MSISDPEEKILLNVMYTHPLSNGDNIHITDGGYPFIQASSVTVITIVANIFQHKILFFPANYKIQKIQSKSGIEFRLLIDGETALQIEIIPKDGGTKIDLSTKKKHEEVGRLVSTIVMSNIFSTVKILEEANFYTHHKLDETLSRKDSKTIVKGLILNMLGEGLTQKQISDKLPVSNKTVINYIAEMKADKNIDFNYFQTVGRMKRKNKKSLKKD